MNERILWHEWILCVRQRERERMFCVCVWIRVPVCVCLIASIRISILILITIRSDIPVKPYADVFLWFFLPDWTESWCGLKKSLVIHQNYVVYSRLHPLCLIKTSTLTWRMSLCATLQEILRACSWSASISRRRRSWRNERRSSGSDIKHYSGWSKCQISKKR